MEMSKTSEPYTDEAFLTHSRSILGDAAIAIADKLKEKPWRMSVSIVISISPEEDAPRTDFMYLGAGPQSHQNFAILNAARRLVDQEGED